MLKIRKQCALLCEAIASVDWVEMNCRHISLQENCIKQAGRYTECLTKVGYHSEDSMMELSI